MTDGELIYLIGVILAFLAFMVTLAYVSNEPQSRRRSRVDVKEGRRASS